MRQATEVEQNVTTDLVLLTDNMFWPAISWSLPCGHHSCLGSTQLPLLSRPGEAAQTNVSAAQQSLSPPKAKTYPTRHEQCSHGGLTACPVACCPMEPGGCSSIAYVLASICNMQIWVVIRIAPTQAAIKHLMPPQGGA